jgi:hypothetical protein
VGFFITALLLGQVLMMNLLQSGGWGIVAPLLAAEFGLILSAKPNARWTVHRLRGGLIAVAMLGAGILLAAPNQLGMWLSLPILLLVWVEEVIGRSLFYTALEEKAM